jgi:hypothetical protein
MFLPANTKQHAYDPEPVPFTSFPSEYKYLRSIILTEELIVVQRGKKFPVLRNPTYHYPVHIIPSLVPTWIQI